MLAITKRFFADETSERDNRNQSGGGSLCGKLPQSYRTLIKWALCILKPAFQLLISFLKTAYSHLTSDDAIIRSGATWHNTKKSVHEKLFTTFLQVVHQPDRNKQITSPI